MNKQDTQHKTSQNAPLLLSPKDQVVISLDAMGGDHGVKTVIPGAQLALNRRPDIRFLFYGNQTLILPLLSAYPALEEASEIVHTEVSVQMDDKPSVALRKGRRHSSMWKAIEAIRKNQAHLCVSAGNTGALMAMAKFCLPAISRIERPAIAGIWPTLRGESIVLDMGANIGANDHQLVDFAIMGGAMARALFDIERPLVGLLNIGVEEIKGLEYVRNAGQTLKELDLENIEYKGFIEGDGIGLGHVDVVVTEGFSGNIALKTAEGTARQISGYLKAAMSRTLTARLGYLLARKAFVRLKEKMDPRKVNGGVFLGLEGIVIKSHGSTDPEGFASAIEMGYDMARNGLIEKIRAGIELYTCLDETSEIKTVKKAKI